MKKFYILYGLLIIGMQPSYGQEVRWNSMPQKGFVFQISNKEAQNLLTLSGPDTIINSLLHTQVDTFDVRKGWIRRPEKGHFILASIVENKLHCEYAGVFPYQVFLLKEYDALTLQVLDLEGNVREDAVVKLKRRRIRLDPESKVYRLANAWFSGDNRIVTVELEGFRSVFNVEKHDVPTWHNDRYDGDGPSFYSYLITDKNRYKPGEKIRYKSFALSRSRFQLRKKLEVWVSGYGPNKKIGDIEPYRPGSYSGEFYLHDSLKLILDQTYNLQLRVKNGRVVSNCSFRYEDYELNGDRLEVQLSASAQFHPAINTLSIRATDVNGLILKDARATVVVKPQSIRETFQTLVMLRDTVMRMEVDLDADEATVVNIPSQLFEKTNTAYEISVKVLNSQNQAIERTVTADHYYSHYELGARFSNDSIVYEFFQNGSLVRNVPFQLRHDNEVNPLTVDLPYKERINPILSVIHLQRDTIAREFYLGSMHPKLELRGGIAKDSIHIRLANPQSLDVSWFVYQGSDLMRRGFGKELEFDTVITDRTRTYYVELLYSFGGVDNVTRREFRFRDDMLNVALDLPDRVYPGQTAEATIAVTNGLGLPVDGVDLTAVGVTGKLNYYLPDLRYYGATSEPRSKKAHFSKHDVRKRTARLDLDFRKWEKRAGLDTMKYYQFTYPIRGRFTFSMPIGDSAQFAPFVMQKGMAVNIHVIEIDRIPVYYGWVDQPSRYSFHVPSHRKVSVTLRLQDRVLLFDSLSFPRGKKTILSIDLDHLPAGVKTYKFDPLPRKNRRDRIRYAFTSVERDRHKNYVAMFKYRSGSAFLDHGGHFIPLFREHEYVSRSIVAGPIMPGQQTFFSPGDAMQTTYHHEGGYTYAFEGNVVYKLTAYSLLPEHLHHGGYNPMTVVNDRVMTRAAFLVPTYIPGKRHIRSVNLVDHAVRMKVLLPHEKAESGFASVLFRHCATAEIISPCQSRLGKSDYYNIPRGCYSVIALYNNGTHFRMDSVAIRPNTRVVIDFNKSPLIPGDSVSRLWLLKASGDCYGEVEAKKVITMRRTVLRDGNIRGVVYAQEDNSPLPGVNVVVKGTTNGTVTDTDGRFALDSESPFVTLQISFIGFTTEEVEVQVGSEITVYLEPDIKQLTEVIVTGQGYSSSYHALGYSLQGRIAGVQIDSDDLEREPEEDEESGIDEAREAERRLYQELLNLSTIRSRFSDVAFWEPRLYTDKKGRSAFTVTFPDDITRWEATVYAMNRQLQTGTGRKVIKSYKPIMAELHTPNFLTRGDSAFFLGKVLNYTEDGTISGKVKWNGSTTEFEKDVKFSEFHLDKLPVFAAADSMVSSYVFTRDDGYLDGEERTVHVVEQGTVRADGTLAVLKNKEEVLVKASPFESVVVEVLANPIDIYAGEARYLMSYPYDCNEQLASKLAGLINYRLIMQFQGKPFRHDKEVNRIITRLLRNQNKEFLWSWWDVSPNTSYWMSAHVLRALRVAVDAGYRVDLDIDNLTRKIAYKFEFLQKISTGDAHLLNALSSWNAKLDYGKYVSTIESIITEEVKNQSKKTGQYGARYSYLEETLLLQEIRLKRNLLYRRDTLLKYQKHGILGTTHFYDDLKPRSWHQDALSVNSIAYRMVKGDSALKDLKVPMQLYFLAERSKNSWNTYHSSNVLMSVLADLVGDGASKQHVAAIRASGKLDAIIDKFPFRIDLAPGEVISLRKESGVPVYFMKYRKERVTKARTGVPGFEIKTSLGKNQTILEAGKPVTLTVEVSVKKEANLEYVMIEIPIPGSCSYAEKTSKKNNVETHREYFKDRTVIFCENMKSGTYSFEVKLLPRFTGNYGINPSQVSLMYIPVVNANTDMKRVKVN